jgi:glycosyltransferase involved in cell wall biosynthesis
MRVMFAGPTATIALNLVPRRGSWGGANQWASQLTRYLRFCGFAVRHDLRVRPDCIIMTHTGLADATAFSAADVLRLKARHPATPCIHRINDNDARKGTTQMDALLEGSSAAADHTVFVSEWLRDHHAAKWFDRSRPHSVIEPGADPAVFHPIGNHPPRAGEPLRVVTHHWSPNWSKGFDVYAEIDAAIASGRLPGFEMWVIGRWPDDLGWQCAKTHPPASGARLANLLRQCHLYVTASRNEPGAMHPVEGIQCGLPVVFHRDSGGTVTQCARFGIVIEGDAAAALDHARERYHELRARVLGAPPSGDLMCLEYRRLVQRLLVGGRE